MSHFSYKKNPLILHAKHTVQPSLDLCRLSKRLENAGRVLDRLNTISSVHKTQPAIQQLLGASEFSGSTFQKITT